MYRKLFETCGDAHMVEPIKEMYKEMQQIKYLDPNKITYGAYH